MRGAGLRGLVGSGAWMWHCQLLEAEAGSKDVPCDCYGLSPGPSCPHRCTGRARSSAPPSSPNFTGAGGDAPGVPNMGVSDCLSWGSSQHQGSHTTKQSFPP